MSRASISLSDLQRYADKLPNRAQGKYYKFPIRCMEPVRYHHPNEMMYAAEFHTIEFHSREIVVDGCRALAWYYHDILVKVAV